MKIMEKEHTNLMNKKLENSTIIKKLLYKQIKKHENIIKQMIITKDNDLIIKIINLCFDQISNIDDNKTMNFTILIEGILHYVLTIALISTQRKIVYNNIEIDMIIPDIKGIINNPQNSLLLYFPKTNNLKTINNELTKYNTIQTIKKNIWIISYEPIHSVMKNYCITNNTIKNIFNDIDKFSKKTKNVFKIFGIK